MSTDTTRRTHTPVLIALALWFVLAAVVGAAGLLGALPVPPPALAVGLALIVLLIIGLAPAAREAVRGLGLRALVAFHLTRILIGAYFLLLYSQGSLPAAFAVPAGIGDILVGLGAVLVLWRALPVRTPTQRFGLILWNVIGLVDILGVLANAARLLLGDTTLGAGFLHLPLALLPTFVVPCVLITHALLFAWTPRPQAASA